MIRVLSVEETFGLRPISGAMGGEPPPVCPPPPPPPPPPPGPGPTPPPPPSPSTIPAIVAIPPGAVTGRAWVEGSALHYIASDGAEYAGTGVSISTPPAAETGKIYIAAERFEYIDASGVKRQLQYTALGAVPSAVEGRVWVDSGTTAGKQLQWIGGSTRFQWWNGV